MSQNADTLVTETPVIAPPVVEPATPLPAPEPVAPYARLQRDIGNAAIARSLIQRKAEDAGSPATTPPPAQTVTPRIVDDKADALPGQMHKTAFLTQLRESVCNAATEAFRGTRWSEEGCPYIERVFAYCAMLGGERLERFIRLYAPETASVATAEELIPIITARVQRSLATFVTTGKVTGVPPGIPSNLSGGMLGMVGGAVSAATNLFFKEQNGSEPKHAADPQQVQTQLGAGKPLEGGVRSRMESAYGESFGNVEVHADSNAAGLSKDLNARAFTVGQHVAFGTGEYRPGTLIGDALIAHELAHVIQQKHGDATAPAQKGTSDHDSFEEEADHAAVGAVVSTWGGAGKGLAKLTNRAMTSLRSGLRLQRCKSEVAIPAEFEMAPTVSPDDEELLDRLEGRHAVYHTYQRYVLAKKFAEMGGSHGLEGNFDAQIHFENVRSELEEELLEEGFNSIAEFETKIDQFEAFFQRYAIQTAFQILRENERLINSESQRYGGLASSNNQLAELKAALEPARVLVEAADRIPSVAKSESDGLGRGVVFRTAPQAIALYEEAEQIKKSLAPRFPILADPDRSVRSLVHADDEELQSLLQSTASDRISDIEKTRQSLADDPELVWQMEVAVQRARASLGIVQDSIYDALIRHKLSELKWDKIFHSILIGALSIGLGILTAGTGTVAVLAGAGLATLSVASVVSEAQDYLIQQAAAGTAFDRAKALTAIEPSLGWLALSIVGAGLDMGAAVGAFRALSGTAKAVSEGAATITDLETKALSVGKQIAKEQELAAAKALEPGVATAGEQAAKQQIIVPEVFADAVADSAKRAQQGKKLLAGSPEAANAIRAAAKGLDDTAVTGILRLSPETRAVVLTKFAGNADVLGRLGMMAEQSEHVVNAVNLLRRNMSEKQFEAIIGHYLKSRDIDTVAELLRAIGQAGVDDEAIKAIASGIGKVQRPKRIVEKFRPQIHEAIAEKLGPGPEGFKKMLEVTEGLHPKQSGTIFEHWAAKYDPNLPNMPKVVGGASERAVFDTRKLKSSYTRNRVISDNWIGSTGTIVEYKHLQTAGKFSGKNLDQLDNYSKLIRDGATFDGKAVNHIEYVFSTREGAEVNADLIRGTLGRQKVTIKYIDPKTGEPVVLPEL
ncbi:MAG TPA: DUF4157 domain-containing protein [Pyrinomonadaceae bacterium]|nr:DUF4157 domain-containing protein [Pyrinomonadaceae bacterium]